MVLRGDAQKNTVWNKKEKSVSKHNKHKKPKNITKNPKELTVKNMLEMHNQK